MFDATMRSPQLNMPEYSKPKAGTILAKKLAEPIPRLTEPDITSYQAGIRGYSGSTF
jgi:hypothetical protein